MQRRTLLFVTSLVTMALAAGCDPATGDGAAPGPTTAKPTKQDGSWLVPEAYYEEPTTHGGGGGAGGGYGYADGEPYPTGAPTEGWDYASADASASAPDAGSSSAYDASGGPTSEDAGPTPPPGPVEVKAGAYDDNAKFEDYLAYLDEQAGLPEVITMDVAERYVLTVVDETSEAPIPNATVLVEAATGGSYEGTTNADGQVLFHPNVSGFDAAAETFTYFVEQAGAKVGEGHFTREWNGGPVTLSAAAVSSGPLEVEIALVIDTTGSMGDEIDKLKATWETVAEAISGLSGQVTFRYSLVVYRDRGDDYIVKYLDFTPLVGDFMDALAECEANGGGDGPEDMQAALDVAVNYLSWSDTAQARVAFILADAPPHLYEQEHTYAASLQEAAARGIRFHGIGASGTSEQAEYVLRQVAQVTLGHFLFLTYDNDIPGQPGSGTGSGGPDGYSVDDDYLSGTLDELVVELVARDVEALIGEE